MLKGDWSSLQDLDEKKEVSKIGYQCQVDMLLMAGIFQKGSNLLYFLLE